MNGSGGVFGIAVIWRLTGVSCQPADKQSGAARQATALTPDCPLR